MQPTEDTRPFVVPCAKLDFGAPLIGVGLYTVSRSLAQGRTPTLAGSFVLARRVAGHAAVFALIQMVILFTWSRAGMLVSAFVEIEPDNRRSLVEFLLIGSAAGSLFALFTFAVAAFSLPLIADRDVDMVTAGISSINAVARNKRVTLLWGLWIAALTLVGFATLLLSLALIMPWLAYCSWHAYRGALDTSSWPPQV